MIRLLGCLMGALVFPTAATALGEKPVLIPPFDDSPCWVSIFDGKDFMPPSAQLKGPTFLESPTTGPVVEEDLRNVGGQDFVDRIDSLVVGPRGRVTVFDEVAFSGKSISFGPNAQIPDLDVYEFGNRIKSVKVTCE